MNREAGSGRRIAFFGGSFDPPHMGHLGIARAAQIALRLDSVLFAPVGMQPLKPNGSSASFKDRVAMTELAIEGLSQFAISLVDAPNPEGAPNYTIETLRKLKEQNPGAMLFTLMGADSFVNLRHWFRGAEIPFAAPLIVASRPGQELGDLSMLVPEGLKIEENQGTATHVADVVLRTYTLRDSSGATAPFYLLPGLDIEISASDIRRQISAARDRLCAGHELLPEAVCEYIAWHHLYSPATAE